MVPRYAEWEGAECGHDEERERGPDVQGHHDTDSGGAPAERIFSGAENP